MGIESVEALLIALLVVIPGGLGDTLARSILTPLPPPRTTFRQLLAAISWSVGALALCEFAYAATTTGAFGGFLIGPIGGLSTAGDVSTSVAWRYAIFVAVAILLPGVRYLYVWVLRRLRKRGIVSITPAQATLDAFHELVDDIPRDPNYRFAFIETEHGRHAGWISWRSTGIDDDAAYVLRAAQDQSLTWVPIRSANSVTIVDPDLLMKPRDYVVGWPDGEVREGAPEVVEHAVRLAHFLSGHEEALEDIAERSGLTIAKPHVDWASELCKVRDGKNWPSVLMVSRLQNVGLEPEFVLDASSYLRGFTPDIRSAKPSDVAPQPPPSGI